MHSRMRACTAKKVALQQELLSPQVFKVTELCTLFAIAITPTIKAVSTTIFFEKCCQNVSPLMNFN